MIALRADGGRTAGLGHVRRCLALADALSSWADCCLLLHGDGGVRASVEGGGVRCLPVASDMESTLLAARTIGADVLVVDSYALSSRDLGAARTNLRLLVAVDDRGRFPLPAHVVVNSAPGLESPEPRDETCYLLGPRFALLARQFAESPIRPFREEVRRVLLVLGGSTPAGVIAVLASATRRALPDAELDIVVGPLGDDTAAVTTALAGLSGFRLHRAPESIRGLMLEADVAVTAGGVTLLEVAAAGTPAVGVCVAPNQEPNLSGFAREGACHLVGRAEDPGLPSAVEAALVELAADSGRRRVMGECARHLVDGRGAERVAEAIRTRLVPAPVAAKMGLC